MSDDGDGVSHLQDPSGLEHEFIFTMAPRSNGKLFRIRCKCMAEYRNVSSHYYNYDYLAEVDSLREAKKVYAKHLEESHARSQGN